MSAETRNGVPARANASQVVEGTVRLLLTFAAAVAAAVAFAWASQARQDDLIGRNETAIAVINARLDFICEKLTEIRSILAEAEDVRAHEGAHSRALETKGAGE